MQRPERERKEPTEFNVIVNLPDWKESKGAK